MLSLTKALEKLSLALVIGLCTVAVNPVRAHADDGVKKPSKGVLLIAKTAQSAGAEADAAMTEFQSELRAARERHGRGENPDYNALSSAYRKAYPALRGLQSALEAASRAIGSNDDEALALMFGLVRAYYSQLGLLHVANETHGQRMGISAGTLSSFELRLACAVADRIAQLQSRQVQSFGGEAHDTSYVLGNGEGKGDKCVKLITLHPRDLTSYRVTALTAFPTKSGVDNALQFLALKAVFVNRAVHNTYLYGDEKIEAPLPDSADPTFVKMKAHADGYAAETAFRRWVQPGTLQPITDSILSKRNTLKFWIETKEAFKLISDLLPHHVDLDKLALAGGSTDQLADRFIQLERAELLSAMHTILRTMPGFMTEMSRADLKALFHRTTVVTIANLLLITLDNGMMDTNQLEEHENLALTAIVTKLAQAGVPENSLNDQVLDEFISIRDRSSELATSVRRYELATKVIKATEVLEALKAGLKEVEHVSENGLIPAKLLANMDPDPGVTLLALGYNQEKLPVWISQILQRIGSQTRDTPQKKVSAAEVRKLKRQLESIPGQLRKHAQKLTQYATSSVIRGLVNAHARQMLDVNYRWMSPEARMAVLIKKAPSTHIKRLVKTFLDMLKVADEHSADALRSTLYGTFNLFLEGRINDSFAKRVEKDLFDERVDGLKQLVKDIDSAQAFIERNSMTISRIFSEDKQVRSKTLKDLLLRKEAYVNYITIRLHELDATFPLIFQPVPMWSQGKDATGNPDPITFGEFVIGLKKAIGRTSLKEKFTPLALAQIDAILPKASAQYGDTLSGKLDLSKLNDTLVFSGGSNSIIAPRNIAITAMMGSRLPKDLWTKTLDLVFSRHEAPMYDSYWPSEFKVRDALPAHPMFDKKSNMATKTLRILVSHFMTPWFRSGVHATKNEQDLLVKFDGDEIRKHWELETYNMLKEEMGEAVGGGIDEMHADYTKWGRWAKRAKVLTMKTQELAHNLFYGSMFVPLPQEVHLGLGRYMGLSAFFDLSADVIMFMDYWSSYSHTRPYAYSGALGGGLVKYSHVQQLKDEVYNLTHIIANRIIFDVWFFGQLIHGERMMFRMWRINKKVESELPKLGISKQEWQNDVNELLKLYMPATVRYGTTIKEFYKLYAAKKQQLDPLIENGDGYAKSALEQLTQLRDKMVEFEKKYGELAHKAIGGAGKSGFYKNEKEIEKLIEQQQAHGGGGHQE